MKKYVIAIVLLISSVVAHGQCQQCEMLESEHYNFCFMDDQFSDLCAQYGIGQTTFRLKSGKKVRELPIGDDYSISYLISLSQDKKLKVTPYEILFIQRALDAWKVEQRKFGHTYTDSGLGYRVITEGPGEKPLEGETVNVHYTGYLEDGTKFDSSYDRDKPFSFKLGAGQVIKGWEEGIARLNRGSKAILRIPPVLGYGSRRIGTIPANSILYFEIELLED